MSKKSKLRNAFYLNFLNSNKNIIIGELPYSEEFLLKKVEKNFNNGLTSLVYKIKVKDKFFALKKAREDTKVASIDGKMAFLNEIFIRDKIENLRKEDIKGLEGFVKTIYANFRDGIILSEWLDGETIKFFDKEILENIFYNLYNLDINGIFEYDLCLGNFLVAPDKKVYMYDFGYAYFFDPLKEYNPDGREFIMANIGERFETRCFMHYLYTLEKSGNDYLKIFKLEKEILNKYFNLKLEYLISHKAKDEIISYYKDEIKNIEKACKNEKDLINLYYNNKVRSFILDIYDDLHGKTCTPNTLEKAKFILNELKTNINKIKKILFWDDAKMNLKQLLDKYEKILEDVKKYQIK